MFANNWKRGRALVRQFNKIRIYSMPNGGYDCVAPDGRVLEHFGFYPNARRWAQATLDFLSPQRQTAALLKSGREHPSLTTRKLCLAKIKRKEASHGSH
jgi:hypothetical protein